VAIRYAVPLRGISRVEVAVAARIPEAVARLAQDAKLAAIIFNVFV